MGHDNVRGRGDTFQILLLLVVPLLCLPKGQKCSHKSPEHTSCPFNTQLQDHFLEKSFSDLWPMHDPLGFVQYCHHTGLLNFYANPMPWKTYFPVPPWLAQCLHRGRPTGILLTITEEREARGRVYVCSYEHRLWARQAGSVLNGSAT